MDLKELFENKLNTTLYNIPQKMDDESDVNYAIVFYVGRSRMDDLNNNSKKTRYEGHLQNYYSDYGTAIKEFELLVDRYTRVHEIDKHCALILFEISSGMIDGIATYYFES